MVRALAICNSLIGILAMTFYALHLKGSALSPDSQGLIFLGVGGVALAAAGMGLNRIGVLFHGFALSLFASWALASGLQGSPTRSFQRALKGLGDHWPLAAAGMACVALGTVIDHRKLVRRKKRGETTAPRPETASQSELRRPRKKQATPTTTPGILIEPVEDNPEKVKITCSCGKRMRIKAEARSVRCPACKTVLKLK